MSDIKSTLKTLVANKRNLREVARESGTPYWTLYEWMRGKVDKLDVDHASKLAEYLTGQGFTVEGGEP